MTLLGFLVLTVVAWVRQHRQLAQRLKAQQEAEARLLEGISEHGRRLRARLAAQSYDYEKARAGVRRQRQRDRARVRVEALVTRGDRSRAPDAPLMQRVK